MGAGNFVQPSGLFTYTVTFENEATATAPAQTVTVTEQLDPNLDWSTFQFGDIGFGDLVISVPPGRTSFSTRVDATATLGVYVDVTAQFNLQTGLITWTFTSLDPATLDLPIDPRVGFLPPNQRPPAGQGFVTYTVQPKANLRTGTRINAQATVVFDTNAPINTAPAFNTIDSGPPTSSINPLPANSPPTFEVTWTGTDDAGGSGVAVFDIYVSDNGGPFTVWLAQTPRTQAAFTGVFGHTYGFYSVATDNVGNREATPTMAQATTVVNVAAMATHFQLTPSAGAPVAGVPFMVTVRVLDDGGSVVTGYRGTVHFGSSDAQAGLPADYTFTAADAGVHTFTVTLFTAGAQTLTAGDVANNLTGQAAVVNAFATPTTASGPAAITYGPDGNVWFVEANTGKIGRIAPNGTITEFPLPSSGSRPLGITVGPDGNLWFTEFNANQIGMISPDGSIIREFLLPTPNSGPEGIVAGPDGNLWFTEYSAGQVGLISPDGSTIIEFPLPTPNGGPLGITVGPDGNLWFTEFLADQIGMISPDGSVLHEFALPTPNSGPMGIAAASDGNLWFTEFNANQVGSIRPDGSTIIESPIPTVDSGPEGIVTAPDGNLWFTEANANQIGQITPSAGSIAQFNEFSVPRSGSMPVGITADPSDTLWFTESQAGAVGQLIPVLTVTAAPANHFVLIAPSQVTARMAFDITVLAVDPYGNVDTHYRGTIHFTSTDSDPGVVLPADYTFQPGDAGMVTFSGGVTLMTAGGQTITVTDMDTGLLTGNATVTVSSGPAPSSGKHERSGRQASSVIGLPSWALVPRLPEMPAFAAAPSRARQSADVRPLAGVGADSFRLGTGSTDDAFLSMPLPRPLAAVGDDVWLDAFRGLWSPFDAALEGRREDGQGA